MKIIHAAALCLMLGGCGGINQPGEVAPVQPSPTAALIVAGNYMQVAVCVLQRIPAGGTDKPEFTEIKSENRAVIRLNLTAGVFYNSVQLFEASFLKHGEMETEIAVRERGSLTGGPDYWKNKIADFAQSCSQQVPQVQSPKRR